MTTCSSSGAGECGVRAALALREASYTGPVTLIGAERHEIGLDHARAGDVVVLSEGGSWFAYPYWLDDRMAPDFARWYRFP